MLTEQFDSFSHSLRVNVEQLFRFYKLYKVDQDEAVGNLEQGFNGILNSFHSLYDSARANQETIGNINFYGIREIACVLAIRNSRHHQASRPILGMFRDLRNRYKEYLPVIPIAFVNFDNDAGSRFMEYYLSANQFLEYLDLPPKENRLPLKTIKLIKSYLPLREIIEKAQQLTNNIENIYINGIPLVINAGISIFPIIQNYIDPISFEAKHFFGLFQEVTITSPEAFIISSTL